VTDFAFCLPAKPSTACGGARPLAAWASQAPNARLSGRPLRGGGRAGEAHRSKEDAEAWVAEVIAARRAGRNIVSGGGGRAR